MTKKKDAKKVEASAVTEAEKLAAAKAAAKEKVSSKRAAPDVNTIKFQKSSGSGIVFEVLEKAKKPLTLTEVTARAVEKGLKNPTRAKDVANWFVNNGLAIKDEKECYALVPKSEKV